MQTTLDDKLHWYKDTIIYELHIKAFRDGNGDGIGDFKGLMNKLDYLQDLGVETIWLLPFYPSPLRDDGYDIADYYSINTRYGNLRDFKGFMREAKKRNLRVITELVVNHTSDQHPWFQRARKAPKGSKYRDFYVWSDDPSKYKDTRIIFTDYEPSNWTWDPVAKQYYWHRFFHHQPDLNYDNPAVQKEVFKMLDFWLDLGVDGFRLDAVPYLFEREGTNCENLPETHAFLKKLRAHVDKKYPGRLLLAEANMWPEDSASYFGDGDECQMNYHFPIMPRMFMALKMENRYPIIDILEQTPEIPETCQWGMFLRNHDELTLEMVTDEERDYMYRMYTKEPEAKINLGIRHRLAPLLENDRRRIELMNVLLFSMPGTPVLYYGDEIGMGDNYYLGDRDGVRTPMQWNADRNAGFSEANPQKLYLPVITDPEYRYEAVNVELQQENQNSLLWWMKRIIAMRKRFKVFGRGSIRFLRPQNPKVLAFIREYQDEHMLIVVNLSRFAVSAELNLQEYAGSQPIEVFSHNKFPEIGDKSYPFTLSPYAYYWLLLEPAKKQVGEGEEEQVPEIKVGLIEEVVSDAKQGTFLKKLVMPYLTRQRWFGGKARTIISSSIHRQEWIRERQYQLAWLLIEIQYNDGLPELYQVPLVFTEAEEESPTKGVLGYLQEKKLRWLVQDAVYHEGFRKDLWKRISKNRREKYEDGLQAYCTREAVSKVKDGETRVELLSAEQSNTSIRINDAFFLKLYRKIDATINPDMEITRFLSEEVNFSNTPRFMGAVSYRSGKENFALGLVQELVPNQGDAWQYMLDVLRQYYERIEGLGEEKDQVPALKGTLLAPVSSAEVPEKVANLVFGAYSEQVSLLGKRTAEMHKALASKQSTPNFGKEAFSLHYQRSLFSSLKSLTRTSFETLENTLNELPETIQEEGQALLARKKEVLTRFQEIYDHKIETQKIRNHGDYHLGQVLYTGRDFVILDFEGEPARSFSERRLLRSPLRDVAGMVRSFHYAAYAALWERDFLHPEDALLLEPWAEQWYHYNAGRFLKAYFKEMEDSDLLPDKQEDTQLLLHIFLLEKAVYELGYELNNRPDWSRIPLRGIDYILNQYQ